MNWQRNSFYQSQVTSDKNVIIYNYKCTLVCCYMYKFQHKYGFMNITFTYLYHWSV